MDRTLKQGSFLRMKTTILFCVCLIFLTSICNAKDKTIIISSKTPDGKTKKLAECSTLAEAKNTVRKLFSGKKVIGPVEVLLTGEKYHVTKPLLFTPEDSGSRKYPVTYCAPEGKKASITGAMEIKNWEIKDNGVWQAKAPKVNNKNLYFRQLYVNGRRAVRARSPNTGYYYINGLICKPKYKDAWRKRAKAFYYRGNEITEQIAANPDLLIVVFQSWLSRQHRVKRHDSKAKAVYVDSFLDVMRERSRYYIENAPELLDVPGEWFLDRKTGVVSYIPRKGEDIKKAVFTVPVVYSLLVFHGDPEKQKYVENLHFRRIKFSYTDWMPYVISGRQARFPVCNNVNYALKAGAISGIGLRNSSFVDCEVNKTGAHAVSLLLGSTDNIIKKCHLHDLGGGGVCLYWQQSDNLQSPQKWHPKTDNGIIQRNTIENCYIHDFTHIFHGSVGILAGASAAHNNIRNNDISYGDYSGISIGWGWSASKENNYPGTVVENNHIHHLFNYRLEDGGGIYLLGRQTGTVVRNNLMHDYHVDILGYGASGLYLDQGTADVLFENNIVYNTAAGMGGSGGLNSVMKNNILACYKIYGLGLGGKWDGKAFAKYIQKPAVFENNIVYTKEKNAVFVSLKFSSRNLKLRNNIYWHGTLDKDKPLFSYKRKMKTFSQWKKLGFDETSIIANPLFTNVEKHNFSLQPGSPALKKGFVPIDMSKVGLYGDKEWTSLPNKTKHAPIVKYPGPGAFKWDYEDEKTGTTPTHSGTIKGANKKYGHKVNVTEEESASGRKCLKIVEGSSSRPSYFPYLRNDIGLFEGSVKLSLSIKMNSKNPSSVDITFRDRKNIGNAEYLPGPNVSISPDGTMTSPANQDLNIKIPLDTWVKLVFEFTLGKNSKKTFKLTVYPAGGKLLSCPELNFNDKDFSQLGRFLIVSMGKEGATFLLDDVELTDENIKRADK